MGYPSFWAACSRYERLNICSLTSFCRFSYRLVLQILSYLIWPCLLFASLVIGFSQMFYSALQIECETAIPATPVCSVRDAYRVVYMLTQGEPLVDAEGVLQMSPNAIILVLLYIVFFGLFLVSLLVTVVVSASKLDFAEIGLEWFWEPKLAFFYTPADLGLPQSRTTDQLSHFDRLQLKMEELWEYLLISLLGGESRKRRHWYTGSSGPNSSALAWPLGVLSALLILLWTIIGACTLGVLWPPQLRRRVFRPLIGQTQNHTTQAIVGPQFHQLRDELLQLKVMSYERSSQVEKELRGLRDLLKVAMKE
jgi:hypothetical protein